ncbi:phage distal tail protein [Streptomyces halobius]|uniref:Phage tail family protein n=1 Tax=Streptomyces halobius TaxID=2879846 RepID=A0ABY4M8Y4_9ACTN|nr:phage tail domain-containing protein [Streptomyces halobius]UQA92860.1 phage tail family protein [Streptomyces halobius]
MAPHLLMADGLIAQDCQIQFGNLLLGEHTPFVGERLTGWDDLPDVDVANVAMPGQHGAWLGQILAGTRVLQWDFSILPEAPEAFPAILNHLRAATALGQEERELVVQLAGARRMMRGRVTRRSLPADRQYTKGEPSGSIVWECSDPRRYSVTEMRARVGLPESEPGLDWGGGLEWPLDWGPAGSTGSVNATNAGDAPAHPIVEFRGPVVRPSLVQTGSGLVLEYDITLAERDTLTVDCAAGTVVLNGSASRLHTATRVSKPEQAFIVEPGSTPMAFRADMAAYDPRASVTVRWRHAYW